MAMMASSGYYLQKDFNYFKNIFFFRKGSSGNDHVHAEFLMK